MRNGETTLGVLWAIHV